MTVCSTCWFANGDGESAHCGRCSCCDPANLGPAILQAIADGDAGTLRVVLAKTLGVDLNDVRAWVNQGDLMLRIEVER